MPLIELENPSGQVEKIRIENLQHYLNRGYKRISTQEPETVELMSPAGKVVVLKKDVNDYLQREGWSLLVEELPAEDETPEKPAEDETPEKPAEDETSETPAEDELPVEDEVPVEEPEIVEADVETINDIPEEGRETDAESKE